LASSIVLDALSYKDCAVGAPQEKSGRMQRRRVSVRITMRFVMIDRPFIKEYYSLRNNIIVALFAQDVNDFGRIFSSIAFPIPPLAMFAPQKCVKSS
jgi:hypothetical protein